MISEISLAKLTEPLSCTISMYLVLMTCEAFSTLFELQFHHVRAVLPGNQDLFPKF